MPKTLVNFPAERMDLGLNQNTPRRLKPGEIHSGLSVRYEAGSSILTGPGYRLAFNLGTTASVDTGYEMMVFPATWVKSGTKIFHSKDGVNTYEIGLTQTTGEKTVMVEQGNGDVFLFNNTDAPQRVAVTSLAADADVANSRVTLKSGDYTKFSSPTGTFYVRGISVTYDKKVTFTADSGTDTLTSNSHLLSNGTTVTVVNSGGALPTGLSAATTYYVVNKTTNTFQLSTTSGGSAIDITANGSGTNSFIAGDSYLRNCTGLTSAMKSGDILTQTSQPATMTVGGVALCGTAACTFNGRLLIAVGETVYYSVGETLAHPEYFYDFTSSGAFQHVFSFPVTALIKGTDRFYIFGARQIEQASGFDDTSSAMLASPVVTGYGAYNQQSVCNMEGDVAFFGNKRIMPIALALSEYAQQSAATNAAQTTTLGQGFDYKVTPWLQSLDAEEDQTKANLFYNTTTKQMKVTGSRGGALETYGRDMRANGFWPKENRPMSCFWMFKGQAYCGSNSNGKAYLDDTGFTNDGAPIEHRWSTGRIGTDEGEQGFLQTYELRRTGFMSMNCSFTINVYIDGASEPNTVLGPYGSELITSTVGIPIGTNGVGFSLTGGSALAVLAFPYKLNTLIRGMMGQDFRFETVCSEPGAFLQENTQFFNAYQLKRSPVTRQ